MTADRFTRVHLLRHGEVENPKGVIYGELPGFGLSDRGRAQARLAASHLSQLVVGAPVLVASPLDRTRETATIVSEVLAQAGKVPEQTLFDRRLIEAATGLDGQPRSFAVARYLRSLLDADARRKKESPTTVVDRMLRAIREITEERQGRDVVFVSHQFPIWMARVGLQWGLGRQNAPLVASLLPSLFIRGRCGLASVSTMVLEGERVKEARYWEPTVALHSRD